MRWTFLHSDFVESEKAMLPVTDLSIQRGYGIFDYLKVINDTPIFIDEHLDRFQQSSLIMRLPLPFSKGNIKNLIFQLIERNNMGTSGIRLTLTGGTSTDGYTVVEPKLIIEQLPLTLPDETLFQKGIKLVSYPYCRTLPQAKSINYLMALWLQDWIKEQQADDVLYHSNSIISECPRANIFMITKAKELITPHNGILKGITRKKILDIASASMIVKERDITISELLESKEVFITSTTKLIIPVLEIDKKPIYNGLPGDTTKQLLNTLTELQTNVYS